MSAPSVRARTLANLRTDNAYKAGVAEATIEILLKMRDDLPERAQITVDNAAHLLGLVKDES